MPINVKQSVNSDIAIKMSKIAGIDVSFLRSQVFDDASSPTQQDILDIVNALTEKDKAKEDAMGQYEKVLVIYESCLSKAILKYYADKVAEDARRKSKDTGGTSAQQKQAASSRKKQIIDSIQKNASECFQARFIALREAVSQTIKNDIEKTLVETKSDEISKFIADNSAMFEKPKGMRIESFIMPSNEESKKKLLAVIEADKGKKKRPDGIMPSNEILRNYYAGLSSHTGIKTKLANSIGVGEFSEITEISIPGQPQKLLMLIHKVEEVDLPSVDARKAYETALGVLSSEQYEQLHLDATQSEYGMEIMRIFQQQRPAGASPAA